MRREPSVRCTAAANLGPADRLAYCHCSFRHRPQSGADFVAAAREHPNWWQRLGMLNDITAFPRGPDAMRQYDELNRLLAKDVRAAYPAAEMKRAPPAVMQSGAHPL